MAHFDLNEQERIDSVKYFWRDWGKYIPAALLLVIVAYISNSVYDSYQQAQAQKAAVVYAEFSVALKSQDKAQALKLATTMQRTLPGVEYTAMASLEAAKLAFEQKNYPQALTFLKSVTANSKDKALQSVATLRMASVYIDMQQIDKAREMLKTKHDLAFDGLFYEGRGDMYLALNDLNKSRDAYKEGLQKAANDPSTQQAIQMKLDVIGG